MRKFVHGTPGLWLGLASFSTAFAQKNPQEYEVAPTFGTTLEGIANGSDGALWFVTKSGGNQVGRITALGAVRTSLRFPWATPPSAQSSQVRTAPCI